MNLWLSTASILWLGLSYFDLKQSLELQKMGSIENNKFLGKHPKPWKLKTFAIVTTLGWLGFALWIAYKGDEGVDAWVAGLLAFGIFGRLWAISKNHNTRKTLTRSTRL